MDNFKFIVNCARISRQAKYVVSFPYNNQLYERIKSLPKEQIKYLPDYKSWQLTTKALFELIKSYKNSNKIIFDFGGQQQRDDFLKQIKKIDEERKEKERIYFELNKKKINSLKLKEDLEKNYLQYSDNLHKNLKPEVKLYKHQITGAIFANYVRNVLISHEMGLGKSLLSIVFCEMNNFSKVFVITPNSLKFNYYNEVDKFTYSKAHILNWKKNQYTIEESKYIIVNYEFFSSSSYKNIVEKLKKLNIGKLDCLICDESSRIKNTKSNTYKNIKKIFVKAAFKDENPTKLFLSGTPMPNRANELYTTMNQIAPEDFPNKKHFYEYYCGMEYDPSAFGGWSRNPTKENLEELYKNISPYTHRKRKMEVLTDLPDKVYQKIILELASKEYSVYDSIEEGVANEYLNQETKNPLTIMLRLRQYTASLKSKIVIELIDRLLEEGDKVVVVDYFKESLQELKQHYGDIAGLHTGDITVEDRNTIVKDFQSEDGMIKIFLGSIQTCSYGLTLTAANKLFVLTLPYSVGEYDQVSDRLHRIGQKDTVNIYPLIFRDTIDEYVFDAIESKRREIVKVMDNEEYVSKVSEALIYEIINKIVKKHGKKL